MTNALKKKLKVGNPPSFRSSFRHPEVGNSFYLFRTEYSRLCRNSNTEHAHPFPRTLVAVFSAIYVPKVAGRYVALQCFISTAFTDRLRPRIEHLSEHLLHGISGYNYCRAVANGQHIRGRCCRRSRSGVDGQVIALLQDWIHVFLVGTFSALS